ncbi:transmembrane protein 50A [Ditylenchus destructor]|uniref:Transmembrane protein 50A n=1 Tax=Ditylenchus destructor TaxID=166010 RepID=A0AAD4R6V9_9BILA|nr:transmembrane protein 50A [Ditylenchus destructor]KAI1717786.1 transmembrane protein 50A [Ditylenchus destructor]
MTTCMESLPCSPQFDWDNKRNTYSSVAAGALFFLGWWLMIDTAVTTEAEHWTNVYFLLTVASTFSLFMVNAVSNGIVQGTAMDEGVLGVKGARLWLMFGFIASFACIVAGIWIMFARYVLVTADHPTWPGVALFLHTFLIFLSSLVYKFGRTEELWD